MPTTYKLNFDGQLLIIFLTLCGLSAAQTYQNEHASCDVGKYKGICLRVSKCLDLAVIAKEMGLQPINVARCGFTATEEIICCPFRPTTAPAPNELPNTITALSNPLGNENIREPQNISPNLFHGQERNRKIPVASGSDFEAQRMNAIFNNNPVQSGNTIINDNDAQNGIFLNANTATYVFRPNNTNEEYAQRLNAALNIGEPQNINTNLFYSQERNRKIPVASGSDFEAQRMNAIFNNNPVQSGNTIINDNDAQNGIFLNANTATYVFRPTSPNEEYAQQLNAALDIGEPQNINSNIFHGQERNSKIPIASGSDFEAQRMNALFNNNPVQSGKTREDSTQRASVIFNGNSVRNGNIVDENISDEALNAILNAVFNISEPQNTNPNVVNENPVQSGKTTEDSTQRTGDVFNGNSVKNGNSPNKNTTTHKMNTVFREPQIINPVGGHTQRQNDICPTINTSFDKILRMANIDPIQDNAAVLYANVDRKDKTNDNTMQFAHHADPFRGYLIQPRNRI